jgi:hypothetical protein
MKTRSMEKELLDAEDIPREDLFLNLRELERVNSLLGGHKLNRVAFQKLDYALGRPIEVVELGSGGGDNLKDLAVWCRKQNLTVRFIGVDLKEDCVEFARASCIDYPEISFLCSDYRDFKPENRVDIVFSSLFCHHLNEEELLDYFRWNKQFAKAFFINDLHRNSFAEKAIKVLTTLFSRSGLVKHDAPASVRRGFIRDDWQRYLQDVSLEAEIHWRWAFRWMILVKNTDDKQDE